MGAIKKFFEERVLNKRCGTGLHVNFINNIRAIIITDLHGKSRYLSNEYLEILKKPYDVCFILGDCTSCDFDFLLPYLDLTKTFGVYGNHDDVDIYKKYGITNIHGKLINVNGKTFVGWEGSYKYKASAIGMTQEESIAFERTLPVADYLISHDGLYTKEKGSAHQGLKGITNYQNRSKCYILRGHLHERYENERERCFYMIEACNL